MGEDLTLFRLEFNGSLRIDARPERLTSEAGAVLLREMLERLGLTDWLVERLDDPRDPDLVTHPWRSCCIRRCSCWGRAGATTTMPSQ